jgi:hypothetical protein
MPTAAPIDVVRTERRPGVLVPAPLRISNALLGGVRTVFAGMSERHMIGIAVLTLKGPAIALRDGLPRLSGPSFAVWDVVHAGDFATN